MTWSTLDVETAGLFLTALAVATAGGAVALLRPARPGGGDRKKLRCTVRKDGFALLARRYGIGVLAALIAAGGCEVLGIPLANTLALGILAGAVAATSLAFLTQEVVVGTSIRIAADAEVEQMARARRASVVGATAMSALVLTWGLVLVFGAYLLTDGAVPDLFGIAVGVGLVSFVATLMNGLPLIGTAQPSVAGPVPRSTHDFARQAIGGTLRSIDLLAVIVASVTSAMFIGYRDPITLLLFPNSIIYPALVAGIGIVALLAGASVWVIERSKGADSGGTYTGLIFATAVVLAGQLVVVILVMNGNLGIFLASALGTAGGAACLVPFLASRTVRETTSSSGPARPSRRLVGPVLGAVSVLAVVAIGSYWAASQLVVARGQSPIPDLGFYGLSLSAVGLVSTLGPALLIALLPELGACAIMLPQSVGQPALPPELIEELKKGGTATGRGARLYTLCTSALCSLGLIAAGRIAMANVRGSTVVGIVESVHQAMWLGALGFALGILAALLLVWLLHRTHQSSSSQGTPLGARDARAKVGVAVAAILVVTLGSLGVNWVWGTNGAFGLALGLLVVGLPLAAGSDPGTILALPSPNPKPPADANSPNVDWDVATWSAVIRTTFLLSTFAIVPFATAITSYYQG